MKKIFVSFLVCLMLLSGCASQPVADTSIPAESSPVVEVVPEEPAVSEEIVEEPIVSEEIEETPQVSEVKETPEVNNKQDKPKTETNKESKTEIPKTESKVETPKTEVSVPDKEPVKEEVKPSEEPKQDLIFTTPVQKPETAHPSEESVEEPDYDEPEVSEVYFSFTGPDGHIWSSSIDYVEGMNVWQYTKQLLDSYGADYKTTGFGKAVYVASMFGYAQKDYGPMSGWMYYVNGVEANKGCGQVTLEEDDSVEWIYVEDYQ